MTETLANGYSYERTQREQSNEYKHDRVLIVFNNFCIFLLWMLVASALKGLSSLRPKTAWKTSNGTYIMEF